MRVLRVQVIALITLAFLLSTTMAQRTSATLDGGPLTYWYTGDNFDVNTEDDWIPFYSGTDVPYSLPLRGFISESRNYFLDFGAVDWLSEWIEYRYGWPVHEHEKEMNEENLTGQLEYLFEMTTARLQKPQTYVDEIRNYTAVDYVEDFDTPFEAFIPLIVMYGLNETYDDTRMHEWVIHPDIVESALNDAFPLVTWETELYWFDYNNATEFADLMAEKTQDTRIMIDDDYLNRTDYILHDIISTDPRYESADMVLPALIMLQHNSLWATFYNMGVGGLGRINSTFPEIDSWCLNGRSVYSYFYGADPELPRASITSTVIHELGHCIGQTDIHSVFGWVCASSSMSAMCAYQQTITFDRFDLDLINNGQGLQLLGRYLDEIDYFRGFMLTTSQEAELVALEDSLALVPDLLVSSDITQLKLIMSEVDATMNLLSSELGEPRKSEDWSDFAPPLEVHIDWIVGPGIPDAEAIVEAIESDLNTSRNITPFEDTVLPTPIYNVTIDVHATTESFDNAVFQFWGRNLVESSTSSFSADEVPVDAWDSLPLNRVFQNQSGYEILGYDVEDWLTDNPYTADIPDKIHYRFYMMNLEDITLVSPDNAAVVVTVVVAGAGVTMIVALVVIKKRKSS